MASTWSELGIRLMATGENSNAWGGQTNDNWNRIEDAADGFATVAVSGATTLTFTTEPTSYADENGRNKVLQFTGTAGSTQAITFPNIEKTYHVLNDSNSILTLTTGTGAATVSLAAGKDMIIYNDGSDEIHNALANLSTTTLSTGAFTATDGSTITTADNTDTLTLTSTDADANSGPNLRFYRNSGSPADGDDLAYIEFEGRNDNSQDVVYGRIRTQIKDASDGTEDGKMDLGSILAGTEIDWLTFNPADPASVIFNEGSADIDFRVESDGRTHAFFVDAGTNTTMIGTNETDFHGNADDLIIGTGSGHKGLTIFTGNDSTGNLNFADGTLTAGNSDRGFIKYDHSTNDMFFSVNGNGSAYSLVLHDGGQVSTGGETVPDTGDGGLCLDQNANDINIISFKSSDIAHGMTSSAETDTYATFKKQNATKGGLQIRVFAEDNADERLVIDCQGEGNITTTKSTSGKGALILGVNNKNGTGNGAVNSDANLVTISNFTNTQFIFDAEGTFHSNVGTATYDEYDDAQLVRAMDLSTSTKGLIASKFDDFVKYNHEDLANASIVGREEDGTPNSMVNWTAMSQLHNGAIWQQYEKHQKLAEAVYEMAKETLGADKADAILKKHDIKLLN